MTTRRAPRVLLSLALACVADAQVVHAQEDMPALEGRAHALETRLARRPSPRMQCDLGFVYYRLSRPIDAARELDLAIGTLGHPTRAADQRLLAQCLYSRGRAAEALGDLQSARSAYMRSRRLRFTEAASAAAEALERRPLTALGREERAVAAIDACAADEGSFELTVVEQTPAASGTRWSVVECGRGEEVTFVAVTCTGEQCVAGVLTTDASYNGGGWVDVASMRVHQGTTPFLELRTHETASERDSCCTPRYPVVDEDDLYVCAITGEGVECTKLTLVDRMHHYAIDATVDDASVTLHRRSGRLPDDPYDPPPPLDRPLTVLELLAPRED